MKAYSTLIYALVILSFFAAISFGQKPQPTVSNQPVFADSPQGTMGAALIKAINSGDKAARTDFVKMFVHEKALERNPARVWFSLLEKLSAQSQGVAVRNISADGQIMTLMLQSKNGKHWTKLVLISNRAAPDKLNDIFVLSAIDPELEQKNQFPKTKMSERQAIETIKRHVEFRAAQDIFSGVVLVAKGGKVIFSNAYGMANKSFNVPNNLNTKFHLGSMDKMYTGVAIAQMVQAGKLSFDDTLAKVLPDYPNKEAAEKITIHQLLTHTAGTGDFISHPEYRARREDFKNIDDYLPIVAGEPLRFEPGSRFSYSNSGYVILGKVIEKLSGKSYFDYVQNHIFNPAGMKDTGYFEANESAPNLAVGYLRLAEEDPFAVKPRRSNVMQLTFKGNSAGGGYSTALDLLRFSQALRAHKLINAELTEIVTSGKVEMKGGARPGKYGYGFIARKINGKEGRGISGGGESSGINSSLEMLWDGSYSVVVVGNYDSPAAEDLNDSISKFLALQ